MQLSYATLEAYRKADKLPRWKRLAAYAALNRLNALYMIQRAGSGHIGSTFSSMDIVTFMMQSHPEIAFFSSKGHDCPAFYVNLIAQGKLPFEMLHKLRRVGGLPSHPELKTPGMLAHSGSLGMGISKAKGLIRANRLKGIKQRVAVLLGDGELQEGQIWESLMDGAFEELTIIVDGNRLGTAEQVPFEPGDIIDAVSGLGYYTRVVSDDGHHFHDLDDGFASGGPLVIYAKTTKGKGVSFMENEPQYHSGVLDEYHYGVAITELQATIKRYLPDTWYGIDCIATRNRKTDNELITAYAAGLYEQGHTNHQIVVLDADLAQDCGLVQFREAFPDRFIECGIAEQDMVSQAGMLAAQGFVPICHSFAAFLTRRANEQIYDNCHQNLKVVYVGTLAGRLPDGPGPSHEALEDINLMRTMPGMEILQPETPEEVGIALHYAVNQAEGPVYIRITANQLERRRI